MANSHFWFNTTCPHKGFIPNYLKYRVIARKETIKKEQLKSHPLQIPIRF
jgi:hypothetical protein